MLKWARWVGLGFLITVLASQALADSPPPVYFFSAPLTKSGINIGCRTASATQSGCLGSSDYSLFNSKLDLTTADSRYLQLAGGTMSGNILMGANAIQSGQLYDGISTGGLFIDSSNQVGTRGSGGAPVLSAQFTAFGTGSQLALSAIGPNSTTHIQEWNRSGHGSGPLAYVDGAGDFVTTQNITAKQYLVNNNIVFANNSANELGIDMNGNGIGDLLDPASPQDAATKNYVDAGMSGKQNSLGYTPENVANKGAVNGYASLDGSGKVPVAQLPSTVMEYQGSWNASTNSPVLANSGCTPDTNGDVYRVSVAGTRNLGSGSISFETGDFIICTAALGVWQDSPAADGVTSVNGSQGAVTVNAINQLTGDVTAGPASGSQSVAATVASVGGVSASSVASGATSANNATNSNTASTIVKRDGSGNFSANTIMASLSGNASTATAFASTPTGCGANQYAVSEDAHGNLTCAQVTYAQLGGSVPIWNQNTTGTSSGFTGNLAGDVSGTQSATVIGQGVVTDDKAALAIKPACAVAATSNQTLSGVPTIDGQSLVDGSLVLLTAQTTASQNGPWVVHTGAWTRPSWYPSGGTTQGIQYSTVFIRLGSTYQGSTWRLTTAAPITIDTSSTTWVVTTVALNSNTVVGQLPIGNGGTGAATQQAAIDALTGTQSSGKYLRSDGTHATLSSILAGDVPILNQSTTGNAATATALASTPAQCSSGNYATGVTAIGGANCAQVAYSQVSGTPTIHYQTVQSNTAAQNQRSNLNFSTNFTLSDSPANDRSTVDLAATISSNTTGNASTATALASTPSQCGTNQWETGSAANGNANCSQPGFSNLSGKAAASQGGTNLDTSASTGYPSISSGTWSVASALSTFQTLYKAVATTAGDILYAGSGGNPARLAIGSQGNPLGVNASGNPYWKPNYCDPSIEVCYYTDFADGVATSNIAPFVTSVATGGTAASSANASSTHPGVFMLNAGTTSSGTSYGRMGTPPAFILGGGALTFEFLAYIPNLSNYNATDTYNAQFGMANATGITPTNGIGFYYIPTTTFTCTGTSANSSSSVTSIGSCSSVVIDATSIQNGMTVTDSKGCFASNTTVSSYNSGTTTLTLNQNTNASGCGASDTLTFTIGNYWVAGNVSSGSRSLQVTSTAVGSATWTKLNAAVNAAGTSIVYSIGTGTPATLSTVATITTNIPTTALMPIFQITKTAGTGTGTEIDVDYFWLHQALTTAR